MLNDVIKSDVTLFIFLSLTALLGWVYPYIGKTLGKKYSALTLSVIDAFVAVVVLSIGFLFMGRDRVGGVIRDLRNMAPYEYAQLIALGAIGTGAGLAGTAIIQHHNIAKFQLHEYIVGMLISAIGIYIFMRDELTLQKVIGLIVIAIGGYTFSI
jgi:drug/metabolite transporter (DMT)-like permease